MQFLGDENVDALGHPPRHMFPQWDGQVGVGKFPFFERVDAIDIGAILLRARVRTGIWTRSLESTHQSQDLEIEVPLKRVKRLILDAPQW